MEVLSEGNIFLKIIKSLINSTVFLVGRSWNAKELFVYLRNGVAYEYSYQRGIITDA